MNKKTIEKLATVFDEDLLVDASHNKNIILQHAYENMEIGLHQESAKLFYLYLSENDPSPEPLNGLAVCMYEMELYDKSMDIINYTLDLFPDDPVSISNKGSLCWQLGDYEQAIYYYTSSITIDPGLIDSRINLINLYRENGDILIAYSQSLKLQSDYPENEEVTDLSNDILLDIALMFY
ncbi:MAG: hypothetical protein ACOCWH_01060 [Spirochaetota bacterium]